MQIPVEITFRDLPRWEKAEDEVRKRAAELERYFDRITSCRVLIEAPHLHQQKGQIYHVRVDLTVPGREIVVKRDPADRKLHEDLYVAIRDAFRAARRQLQDYVRERRGLVKAHDTPPHGRVTKLFAEEGYGFLETPDGEEVYFHRNAVHEGFDELAVGSEVRYTEEEGDRGPQATSVRLVGRHHHLT
ncbi:MAG TPA: HPF/RaiA family ribosome-associated protein [Planctomycetota bacterium]|nr:HPF/RaiA family ribosome-associated protein [Planctomycetota bacterium]